MTFNKLERAFREQMLATGLFTWKRKNYYKLLDVEGFLKSPEDFNQKLKKYDLRLSDIPKYGGEEFVLHVTAGDVYAYVFILGNRKNMELLVKYKTNLQQWFVPNHYQLSDEHFDDIKKILKRKFPRLSQICLCGHPYNLHYGSDTGERDEPCLAEDCECEDFEPRDSGED